MSRSIKLVSYNILQGMYIQALLESLQREQPDILCLQEIGTSGIGQKHSSDNVLELICAALHMEGDYENMFWADEGEGRFNSGVAILSRFTRTNRMVFRYERITDKVLRLTDTDRYFVPRVLLGNELLINEKPVWVFTTHFTISPDAQVTQHQLENAQTVAAQLKAYPEYMFCGDMNTPYGSQVFEILQGESESVFGGGLPTLHPTLHRVGHLGLQVDHAFVRSDRVTITSSTVPTVDGSDHLPLVIEFNLA